MNRRGFLQRVLAGAAVGVAHELDLERLLWVPGQKTIFLPPPQCNRFWIDEVFTREAMRLLESNLAFVRLINREYDAKFDAVDTQTGIAIRFVKQFDISRVETLRVGL